ncbi:alpha/beta hydrolase [Tropicimonas sp. TH_r6]|uniref:alpha/beta hydrolase n=1 Tax=Tropicimonas sp. TH_r6 TaxID=3082085 RepID=UPI0029558485|nr:alpha/beta hydrolase [Tropicimonas sp. TH_r6]MDV7142786.1 alpha/beta hydrolase [Tropicimonas sp. TH_r6]
MEPAPFFANIADAPRGASAFWRVASDGVRLRIAELAPPPDGAKGTVLLFSGRTEYVEKYGPAAAALQARGFACLSLDWRGQGLSDRPLDDPATGHVLEFCEYQRDVAALLAVAEERALPRPYYLIAHSMGGGIGLRALHDGLPVKAVAFSGPMWGIALPAIYRPIARLLAALSHSTGFGHNYAPSTKPVTYVLEAPFEDNTLTTDPGMFDWMRRQLIAHPELALGGPSMTWLNAAFREMRQLRTLPAPALPCLTWVGTNERIVEMDAIRQMMAEWPGGTLKEIPGGEHEVMMESAEIRDAFFDAAAGLFAHST